MNSINPIEIKQKPQASSRTHSLDQLGKHHLCDHLTVFTPSGEQVAQLMDRARQDIEGLTTTDIVQRVSTFNPDCFWAIRRQRRGSEVDKDPRGFVAFLMLNEFGADALIRGGLDAKNPPLEMLAGQNEKPAAIYVWALHAKGLLAPALGLVMEKLQTPLYSDVDFLARAATKEGDEFVRALGFKRGIWRQNRYYERIFHYKREINFSDLVIKTNDWRPPYDSYVDTSSTEEKNGLRLGITVAHSMEDMLKAFSIRAAVYMGEQSCPYDEEYDGNDFSGTHILGYADNEPVGCLRIRYFSEFVKLERLAVREGYRHLGIGTLMVEAAIEFCRTKGYKALNAHSQERLLSFWKSLGFSEVPDTPSFVFSDYRYVSVIRSISGSNQSLSLNSDPYTLIRPEGCWDRPGILEKSTSRATLDSRAEI